MPVSKHEQLVRSLKNEVEAKVQSGQERVVEQLLKSHPDIADDEEAALDLLYTEIAAREELGKPVATNDLVKQFPHWQDRIERLMAVHASFRDLSQQETDAAQNDTDNFSDVLAEARPLQRIGEYELYEEVGRGGMGVVYRARQAKLNRIVAIKLVHGVSTDRTAIRRLIQEAQTVAKLQHPGIVQIHDAKFASNSSYICLEYMEDGSLGQKLSQATLSPSDAVSLMQQLASAVNFAHTRGIIHRDLKPANVLLDKHGQPKIADFGLAKALLEEAHDTSTQRLTRTGALLGSLCYMAPEQVAAQLDQIGPATDVYGLGTILYEMLVGRPPFVRESPIETANEILNSEVVSPRLLAPDIPRDVEIICLKCLQKRPSDRYASAQRLQEDLDRYSSGIPIHARPASYLTRTLKWIRRRPALATILVSFVVFPSLFGGTQWRHASLMQSAATQLNVALSGETAARREADKQFWRVFESVASVHRRLADAGLEHEPQMQTARLDVANDAIRLTEQLASEQPQENRIRRELARLLKLRGRIHLEIGNYEAALQDYDESLEAYTTIEDSDSGHDNQSGEIAAVWAGKGEALKWQMRSKEAEQAFAKSVEMLTTLVESHPRENQELQWDLLQAVTGLSETLQRLGQSQKASQLLQQAEQRSQTAMLEATDTGRAHSIRGQLLWALARLADERTEHVSAREQSELALEQFRRALEFAPGNRGYQDLLLDASIFYAEQLQAEMRFEEAGRSLERSAALVDELTARYPSIQRYQAQHVAVLQAQSLNEANLGNSDNGVALAEQALNLRRESLEYAADNRRSILSFGVSLANLANRIAVNQPGNLEAVQRAESYAREAIAIAQREDLQSLETAQIIRFARYNLILTLIRQQRLNDCRQELGLLAANVSNRPKDLRFLADAWNELFNAALQFEDEPLTRVAKEETLAALHRAVQAGYRNTQELESTAALDTLRNTEEFQAILQAANNLAQSQP